MQKKIAPNDAFWMLTKAKGVFHTAQSSRTGALSQDVV